MIARPFLSHKREDARQLALLRDELSLRGAAGWQDVGELRLGERWLAAFLRAIGRDTNGFIWWGTKLSLTSSTICEVEIPRALRRARRRWRRRKYPVVPLFVDLDPVADRALLERALGKRHTEQLLGMQGLVRENRESVRDFARRSGRRYVKDVIRTRGTRALRVQISGGRQPTLKGDLSLDWRTLLDQDGNPESTAQLARARETLVDVRVAAQGLARVPHIVVEPHLRVPLGALVGWEWNRVRPVKLEIEQVSSEGSCRIGERAIRPVALPAPRRAPGFEGSGPAVVAVSVGSSLEQTLVRYGGEIETCEVVHLHMPLSGRLLTGDEIAAAAAWAAGELARLNDLGCDKHLIVLGPVGLATRIGASAHGCGPVWVPFWDGASGYRGGVEIGGSSFGGNGNAAL